MTYQEFCDSFRSAHENARRLYAAEAKGTRLTINGMDDACLAYILSDGFVTDGADAAAAEAIREVDNDFATV